MPAGLMEERSSGRWVGRSGRGKPPLPAKWSAEPFRRACTGLVSIPLLSGRIACGRASSLRQQRQGWIRCVSRSTPGTGHSRQWLSTFDQDRSLETTLLRNWGCEPPQESATARAKGEAPGAWVECGHAPDSLPMVLAAARWLDARTGGASRLGDRPRRPGRKGCDHLAGGRAGLPRKTRGLSWPVAVSPPRSRRIPEGSQGPGSRRPITRTVALSTSI